MIGASEISQKIEDDTGLAKSRKYLMFVSLILLALTFSGTKITEANTFLFKLTFTNSEGIVDLLLLSIAFLVIRYYSNAAKYHKAIYDDWTSRLLKDEFFYFICEHSYAQSGYMVDIAPKYAGYNDESFRHDEDCPYIKVKFHANWFINAQFQYYLLNRNGHMQDQKIYLFRFSMFLASLKALWLVLNHWIDAQVRYRESLDIFAPYLIFFITTSSVLLNKG
jgi:hypothetical protein